MQTLQGPIAALLCATLVMPAAGAAATSSPYGVQAKNPPTYNSAPLQGDRRILHALNRFTFGPRPGDLEAVRAMGLEKWFQQQLHPQQLDEAELDAHLAQFPAMQWTTQNLLYYLPSNAVLRQVINGRLAIPQGGIERAIYQNQIDRIRARQQGRKKNQALAQNPMTEGAGSMQNNAALEAERSESPTPMSKAVFGSAAQPDMANSMRPGASLRAQHRPPFNADLFESVVALGTQQRVEKLAAMDQPELDNFMRSLKPRQRQRLVENLSPGQKEQVAALENPQRLVAEELIAERLTRDIYSNAQLQEVMTDFWLNHFNIYLRKNELMPYYLVSYARDSIRPYALGKFEDLLESVAHSPAMLIYLDNASSIGPDSLAARRAARRAWRMPNRKRKAPEGLNENYGRELMELHTVGVNGGYTQKDVIQAARILTGWTVQRPLRGGGFVFNPNRHQPGTETVMGKKFKDHGEAQGREFLHFLATRPATAQFLSRELAERFVSDNPPQSLVDRMAHTYISSDGDISAVLTTLFHSPEFWASSDNGSKVKTPLEFVVSAIRASNAQVSNLRPLAYALRQMGMPLYGCVPPAGYSWEESAWVSSGALVDRMNFALALASNRLPGIRTSWSATANRDTEGTPSPQAEEARLQSVLLPGGVSNSTRSAVLEEFEKRSAKPDTLDDQRPAMKARRMNPREREDQLVAGLLLGSPEFQRR